MVVPLGGFVPSAGALVLVWSYLLVGSLILCDAILLAQQQQQVHTKHTDGNSVGIPKTAQAALGTGGSRVATVLLVSLTMATLVSQLSRAGSLWASQHGNSLGQYRLGCTVVALVGVAVTYQGGAPAPPKTSQTTTVTPTASTTTSFADKFNAVLTAIFLGSAVLLFSAVSGVADWSACWRVTTTTITTSTLWLPKILQASPIMLQLLVYGEILPNVCRMLDFDRPSIRRAVVVGTLIPLLLLTTWAALGVALIPATSSVLSNSLPQDPVEIMLATGSPAVQRRLWTLAVSAIGTTILGSLLALQSAYDDWKTMLPHDKHSLWHSSWMRALVIAAPPLLISWISPSLFLQAIDFAGSYPVLLLYGVLPPLMMHRLRGRHGKQRAVHMVVGTFSALLVGWNVLSDGGWWLKQVLAAVGR